METTTSALKMIIGFSLLFSIYSCKQRSFNNIASTANSGADVAVAEWAGRLVLPVSNGPEQPLNSGCPTMRGVDGQRRTDGGVWFEVLAAPASQSTLVGRRLWLKYDPNSRVGRWAKQLDITRDVKFTAATNASLGQGNVHPVRLHCLSNVSPLESLAGGRAIDDVFVKLKGEVKTLREVGISGSAIAVTVNTLQITTEPVQVSGPLKNLVQFIRENGVLKAKYYSAATRGFSGPVESVEFVTTAANPEFRIGVVPESGFKPSEIPTLSAYDLEKDPMNTEGWYIYGQRNGDKNFAIRGMEPRQLLRIDAKNPLLQDSVDGKQAVQTYLGKTSFFETEKQKRNQWQRPLNSNMAAGATSTKDEAIKGWQLGARAFLIHAFGWRRGPAELGGDVPVKVIDLVSGHAAFGTSTVVREPITGELRLDSEYIQVYAHGRQGILAGPSSWNAYMGSLDRGWAWRIAVSDVLIRNPLLTHPFKSKSGAQFSLLDGDINKDATGSYRGILDELLHTAQGFRIGKTGDGLSEVKPWTSCSQDISKSLFFAVSRYQRVAQNAGGPLPLINATASPEYDKSLILEVDQLASRLMDSLRVGIFPVRESWATEEKFLNSLEATESLKNEEMETKLAALKLELETRESAKESLVSNISEAVGSLATMIPRHTHDMFARLFLETPRSDGMVIRTNQMGVNWPNLCPTSPSSITIRDKRAGNGRACP